MATSTAQSETATRRESTAEDGLKGRPILVLSWGVPPTITGISTVMSNLAKQFEHGEMILAGERPAKEREFSWRPDWPQICYLTRELPDGWRGKRLWRQLMFPLLLYRSIRLVRNSGCRAVLTVFPDETFLLAGYLTAAWTGAQLYPYFHNTYLENRAGLSSWFARWLQGRVFRQAAHVFVMSEGMAQLYRERYPGLECSPLVHSCDLPIPAFSPPPLPRSPLRLAICGHIWDACLDATERVCEAVSQMDDSRLTFFCGNPAALVGMGLTRERISAETAPHGKLIERLQDSDILVLPHGFTGSLSRAEYETIFPTRTIEYLWSGRPILAHSPRSCFLTRFLKENGCALVVEEPSVDALTAAIRRLRDDGLLRAELVRNSLRTAQMFHGPRVARGLRRKMTAIVETEA